MNPHKMLIQHTKLDMMCMGLSDFDSVNRWCIEEGWNLGLHDSDIYSHADPTGHLLFLKNGIPVGSISVLRHDKKFATIGPYIVRKEYRRQGYGSMIWEQAFSHLFAQELPNILLYAVPAQMSRYEALGFQTQFLNKRWKLIAQPSPPDMDARTLPITRENIATIATYDCSVFTASRTLIFKKLLSYPDIKGFLVKSDNGLSGFGFIRPCIQGYRIGPLIADDMKSTQYLITALIKSVNTGQIIIDSPGDQSDFTSLMTQFGFCRMPEDDTVAMVKGEPIQAFIENLNRHYAIFSLEVG